MKISIDLPNGYAKYLAVIAQSNKRALKEEVTEFMKETVLSDIDLMQGQDLARLFDLEKDYQKAYDP